MSGFVITGGVTTVVLHEQAATSIVVPDGRARIVLTEKPRDSVVVTMAIPGPIGKQGNPGPAGGALLLPVGPNPISGHSAVACNAAGELIPADCTDPDHLGAVFGVVVNAYSPGEDAEVKTGVPLEHAGWTWTPGPVYVGAAGQLSQTLPAGALFCQVIGHALSATRVLVDLQPPIAFS